MHGHPTPSSANNSMNFLQAVSALQVHSSGAADSTPHDVGDVQECVNRLKAWLLSVDFAEWTQSWPLDQQQQRRLARTLVSLPDRIANTYEGNTPSFFAYQQFFALFTTKLNDALSRRFTAIDAQRYAVLLDCAAGIGALPFIAVALGSLRGSLCSRWSAVLALCPNGADIALATLIRVTAIDRIPCHDFVSLCSDLFGQADSPLVTSAVSATSMLTLPWHARSAFVCYLDAIHFTGVTLAHWLQIWSKHDLHSWASPALKKSLSESLLLVTGILQERCRADTTSPIPFDPTQTVSFLARGMPLWLGSCERDRISAQVIAEELCKIVPGAEVLSFDLQPDETVLWLRQCVEAGRSLAGATDIAGESPTPSKIGSQGGPPSLASTHPTYATVPALLLDSDDDDDATTADIVSSHPTANGAAKPTTAVPVFLSECLQALHAHNAHSAASDVNRAVSPSQHSLFDVRQVLSNLPQIIRASPRWVVDEAAASLAGELFLRLQSVQSEDDIESTMQAFVQLVVTSPACSLRPLVENLNSDRQYNDIQRLLVLDLIGQSCTALASTPHSPSNPAVPHQSSPPVSRIGTIKRERSHSTRVSTQNRIGEIAHFVLAALLGVSRPDWNPVVFNRRLWAIAQVLSNSCHLSEFASLATDVWEWLLTLSATFANSDTRLAALTVFLATTSVLVPTTTRAHAMDPLFPLVAQLAAEWGQNESDKALQTASIVLVRDLGRLQGRRPT